MCASSTFTLRIAGSKQYTLLGHKKTYASHPISQRQSRLLRALCFAFDFILCVRTDAGLPHIFVVEANVSGAWALQTKVRQRQSIGVPPSLRMSSEKKNLCSSWKIRTRNFAVDCRIVCEGLIVKYMRLVSLSRQA